MKEYCLKYPDNQKVNVDNTMAEIISIYHHALKRGNKPFFKYQLKLMQNILKYIIKLGKTNNIRFVCGNLDFYRDFICKHFINQGYNLSKINMSINWVKYNLRY